MRIVAYFMILINSTWWMTAWSYRNPRNIWAQTWLFWFVHDHDFIDKYYLKDKDADVR